MFKMPIFRQNKYSQNKSNEIKENRMVFLEQDDFNLFPQSIPPEEVPSTPDHSTKDNLKELSGLDNILAFEAYEFEIQKALHRVNELDREYPAPSDIEEFFKLEPDAKKMIKLYDLYTNLMKEDHLSVGALRGFYDVFGSTDELLRRLELMESLSQYTSFHDNLNLLFNSNRGFDLGKLLKFAKSLREVGLKGGFVTLYESTECTDKELKVAVSKVAKVVKEGDNVANIVKELQGNVDQFLVDFRNASSALSGRFPEKDIIFLVSYGDKSNQKRFLEFTVEISKRKEMDVSAIMSLYKASNKDVERAKKTLELIDYKIPGSSLFIVAGMKGNIDYIVYYFKELQSKLCASSVFGAFVIEKWYEVEKDVSKILRFAEEIEKLEIKAPVISMGDVGPKSPLLNIYKLEKNPELIKKNLARIRKFEALGNSFNSALQMALMFPDVPEDVQLDSFKKIKTVEIVDTKVKRSILWALVNSSSLVKKDTMESLEKIHELDRDEGSLVYADEDVGLKFIRDMYSQYRYSSPQHIMNLWRVNQDAIIASRIYNFANVNELKLLEKSRDRWGQLGNAIYTIMIESKGNNNRLELLKFMYQKTLFTSAENVRGFLGDPSFQYCEKIQGMIRNPEEALKIGRNIFLEGIILVDEITPELVLEAERKIVEIRDKYREMDVFRNRDVVLVGNAEIWRNEEGKAPLPLELIGKHKFITPELVKNLRQSIGVNNSRKSLSVFEASSENPSPEELDEMEASILHAVETTPPPFTFLFEGHGGKQELYYINGQISNDVQNNAGGTEFLLAEKLAKAIAKRKMNFAGQEEELAKDVYIFSSCYSHNYMRQVLDINKENGGVQPILIGSSEYGQYAFSQLNDKDDENYTVLGIGSDDTSLGALIERTEKGGQIDSDFSIYVPDPAGIPKQITRREISDQKSSPV